MLWNCGWCRFWVNIGCRVVCCWKCLILVSNYGWMWFVYNLGLVSWWWIWSRFWIGRKVGIGCSMDFWCFGWLCNLCCCWWWIFSGVRLCVFIGSVCCFLEWFLGVIVCVCCCLCRFVNFIVVCFLMINCWWCLLFSSNVIVVWLSVFVMCYCWWCLLLVVFMFGVILVYWFICVILVWRRVCRYWCWLRLGRW